VLLNWLAALFFGLAVARTLEHTTLATLRDEPSSRGHRLALGGLAAAVALAVMAAAFGVNGQQLILVVLLPGLGWAAARLGLRPGGWLAAALLVGLATAAPLLFFDPDELNLALNLGYRDVGYYAFLATIVGMAAAWALSLAALLLGGRAIGRRAWAASAILSVVGLALVYALTGQTGWHGERLFVILRDQANIGSAVVINDPGERRAVVYDLLTHHAAATQADLRQTLDRFGVPYTPYYLVNSLEVQGGPLLRWWLSRRPEVERVLVSPVVRPLPVAPALPEANPDVTPPSLLWSQLLIRVPQVWNRLGVTGEGIVVGQNDSGADVTHLELHDNYRGNTPGGPTGDDYNWLDPWNGTTSPTDFGGHGTHTLGTAVGRNVGVAPDATWIACVNLARNLGNPPRYLDCLQFLLAPFPQGGNPFEDGRPDLGANVLNNSWGCPPQEGCEVNTLLPAARALRAAGVFVVVSAGNNGPTCGSIDGPLALYDEVFTVGAVDEARRVAEFSSRGPVTADGSGRIKPDIAAPGVEVTSAVPGNNYVAYDGTSMAGPHVVGVVALLWSANPALIGDIDRTEQILTETAINIAPDAFDGPTCGVVRKQPNSFVGYGIVNALAAVERALAER
ncbi:MAG TPA: S8 family serine peptidase, partial [Promineifilum sp.]|nr:S8 family serine peptidase [Promineifilum sp.]